MAEESGASADNNLDNASQNVPPASNPDNAGSHQTQGESTQESIAKQDCKPCNITVVSPPNDNREAQIANTISTQANVISRRSNFINITGIVVSGLLFILTLLTLYETRKSIAVSQKAVDISKDALEYTKNTTRHKDSTGSINQIAIDTLNVRRDRNAKIIADNNFKLQKLSVESQKKSLQDASNRFVIENQSFLEFKSFTIQSINVGEYLKCFFEMVNLGKYPAKVISEEYGMDIVDTPIYHPLESPRKYIANVLYQTVTLAQNIPYPQKFTQFPALTQIQVNQLNSGKYLVYFFGKIVYKNKLNDMPRVYYFNVNLIHPPTTDYKLTQSDNTNL